MPFRFLLANSSLAGKNYRRICRPSILLARRSRVHTHTHTHTDVLIHVYANFIYCYILDIYQQ